MQALVKAVARTEALVQSQPAALRGARCRETTMTGKVKQVLNVLVLGLGLSCPLIAKADDQQLVVDYLDSIGAESEYYRIYPIAEDYVGRTFPSASFFAVQFFQYPYFVYPPDPLEKQSNVFIVVSGSVSFVDDGDGLKAFFASQLRPVPDPESAKNAGSTGLRLSGVDT